MNTIKINKKEHQFSKTSSLKDILDQLDIVQNGIAIAINQNIIPKHKWHSTLLNNLDSLLIITATQGG